MSKYITVVLEYKDGQEQPRFGAGMKVLDGNVDSVQFDNALAEFEKMDDKLSRTKAELEEARKAIQKIESIAHCQDDMYEANRVISKIDDISCGFLSNQQCEE